MTDSLAPSSEPASTPAHLLFVDDEANILKTLKRLFRSADYVVHLAEGGAEGLQVLAEHAIDVVISDMRMPKMDGAEFLTQVAERWPGTVRILLTGYADLESTVAAVNKGRIYCYCSKPWEDHELKMLVNNGIEQKRLRDERQHLFAIIHQQNEGLKALNGHLEEKIEQRTGQLRLSLQKIDQAHAALKRQYTDAVKVFAKIIEMRPGIKSGHSKYIAENARDVAQRMGLEPEQVKDVLYAGLLLQIGKMSLSDDLLQQPLHLLSSHDKRHYQHHAEEGSKLLRGIEQLKNASELILHQYQRYDGTGTPCGLKGDDIPLGARILAVIRDYICYLDGDITGMAMSVEQAKSRLLLRENSDYDPAVVDSFLALLAEADDKRPVIDISWTQLQPGMEAAEIIFNDVLYLKNTVLTETQIENILDMRLNCKSMLLRIRV
ncbi:MAG: response regulator [Methylomonas sp.]|nr:response regulator [Methylomonas sp.]PPD19412.1 MAG: two-component system response regulator [Methylomonas sp.]PPD25329.1 MAG: two-component system response regulator [Methylomonas sp.]PPD35294.1 MAG: two-component system response regulator [Methylomonas sp.]PPD51418.1 MAG: two-component system response regulator [Methylomonas sp.]